MNYSLSAELQGHEQDVRSVTRLAGNMIGTGSRDRSVAIWKKDQESPIHYAQHRRFFQHENFVATVTSIDPCPAYPSGAIASGSNDTTIHVWSLDSTGEPMYSLIGHESVVSCITSAADGTIISGSWDKTIRVWQNGACVAVLRGHQHSVLALATLPNGSIVSGSADKTIKIWSDGKAIKTYTGHEDAVRGVVYVDGLGVVSCSNDCTIKIWDENGSQLATLPGHESFIYALDVFGDTLITASEDRTVRVWSVSRQECTQMIYHPKPVWSVAFLENGDFVSGCQDTVARVWTAEKTRIAAQETIDLFNQHVAAASTPDPQSAQPMNVHNMPGPEALHSPGNRDGQHIFIREGDMAFVYQWSETARTWTKLGQVTGQAAPAKRSIEGVEYDYVFDVDLDDGLVLPIGFNNGDNPYEVAQDFILKHELPQAYLDAIAQHLVQNSSQHQAPPTYDFSRNPDPFTGQSRNVPQSAPAPSQTQRPANQIIPMKTVVRFDNITTEKLKMKIFQFNSELDQSMESCHLALGAPQLGGIDRIASALSLNGVGCQLNPLDLESIGLLLQWPKNKLFPVFDLLRCAVMNQQGAAFLNQREDLLNNLLDMDLKEEGNTMIMLFLRFLANLVANPAAATLVSNNCCKILEATALLDMSQLDKTIRLSYATLLMNVSIFLLDTPNGFDMKLLVLTALATLLPSEQDADIQRRLLYSLANTLYNDQGIIDIGKEIEVGSVVASIKAEGESKAIIDYIRSVL